jgi:hypothetical protein
MDGYDAQTDKRQKDRQSVLTNNSLNDDMDAVCCVLDLLQLRAYDHTFIELDGGLGRGHCQARHFMRQDRKQEVKEGRYLVS